MGHATPEELEDLDAVLARVRAWPHVNEPSPNAFYVKRTPFLHFHTKDGRRWADARRGKEWGPKIEIPLPASRAQSAQFLSTVEACYRETVAAVVKR